jgi:hypothetical protein
VYQLYGVPFFIWNSSQFGQPLPQLAIDWEDSSADSHFFLERTPAGRRNTKIVEAVEEVDDAVAIFARVGEGVVVRNRAFKEDGQRNRFLDLARSSMNELRN